MPEQDELAEDLVRLGILVPGRGLATGVPVALLRTREAVELKAFLAQNYPGAFMVLAEADEVVGRGFKRWRNV